MPCGLNDKSGSPDEVLFAIGMKSLGLSTCYFSMRSQAHLSQLVLSSIRCQAVVAPRIKLVNKRTES